MTKTKLKPETRQFNVHLTVERREIWSVDAESEEEARELVNAMDESVIVDETGGETINWKITGVKDVGPAA